MISFQIYVFFLWIKFLKVQLIYTFYLEKYVVKEYNEVKYGHYGAKRNFEIHQVEAFVLKDHAVLAN